MTRSQILLEPWQHKYLAEVARKNGKSVSAVIRQWVDEKASARATGRGDPLFGLVGIVADAASDVSENHDAYLYGRKAKRRQ